MENTENRCRLTRIAVGQVELWTAPFGEKRATITATEAGTKKVLLHLHQKLPDVIELMVDDEDFCEEDMEGAFSIIVDPEIVQISVIPGNGLLAFEVMKECDDECEQCEERAEEPEDAE